MSCGGSSAVARHRDLAGGAICGHGCRGGATGGGLRALICWGSGCCSASGFWRYCVGVSSGFAPDVARGVERGVEPGARIGRRCDRGRRPPPFPSPMKGEGSASRWAAVWGVAVWGWRARPGLPGGHGDCGAGAHRSGQGGSGYQRGAPGAPAGASGGDIWAKVNGAGSALGV